MLTIQAWLSGLGRKRPMRECPLWPPDLFAISGALLKRSGAYLRVFEHDGTRGYLDTVVGEGQAWRSKLDALKDFTLPNLRGALPAGVSHSWATVIKSRDMPLSDIRESRVIAEQLIRMALIADEASAGIGVDWVQTRRRSAVPSSFLSVSDQIKYARTHRSFCLDISDDVICVLGKQHTPQRGATFRSLSHHLSLHLPNDIEARWIGPYQKRSTDEDRRRTINLLLLPWPTHVDTADFSEMLSQANVLRPTLAGYFRFNPKRPESPTRFEQRLRRAIGAARQHAGDIDAVVFPELALTDGQYEVAEQLALEERLMLVCGVRSSGRGKHRDRNLCVLQPAGVLRDTGGRGRAKQQLAESLRLIQFKHHRWHLDREQIVNYQLGGCLPVSRGCWENIELPRRLLHFVTIDWMTWSVLICEDLARQDPAADLIRAVGPNLLIALLMDGPQLSGRWASRYASVLAEDPGTSVLTLTSLGMAERCRPILRSTGKRADPSRVIALWRDIDAGEIEIALDAKDDACILSLECRLKEEYSADSRSDGEQSRYPVFAGFKSFRTEP